MSALRAGTSARALAACALLLALSAGFAGAVQRSAVPRHTAAADTTRPRHGSVTMEPGYYPPNDPESASVRIGRRLNAPYVSKRFKGGAPSLVALAKRVCHALDVNRSDSLLSLCVHEDEFRDIMWREFPQSRPVTGVTWGDAWMFLYGRVHGGSVSAIKEYGGHHYEFLRFERYDTTAVYKNFKLHNGLILFVKDDEGQVQRWTWLRSVAERKGSFKIYSMKD